MGYPTEARRRVDQRDQHPSRYHRRSISGALALTLLDSECQVINGGAASRTVSLPVVTDADSGFRFVIVNSGDTESLVVGGGLATLAPGDWTEVFSDAADWHVATYYVAP